MEQFDCKTKILSGIGALERLKDLGIRRLLVVSDPFFAKNGMAEKISKLTGAEYTRIFSDVKPDPTVELTAQGTAVVKETEPDTVLALGGGSAMDCAKAMAFFSGLPVHLVAIPTTSGSGSEVTDFAILTHHQVKHPLVDEKLRPAVAVLDASLLENLPAALVAEGGFDLLSHALEGFVATGAGAISDALAGAAFRTALADLPRSYAGDRTVRQRIHEAASMAGMAFSQAGLGLCHAISHSLGGLFHLPHGRLNAILLPAVIECNTPAAGEKYAQLARMAGLGGSADTVALRALKNTLLRLRRELQLPQTLAEAGIAPQKVWQHTPQIVKAVLQDPCSRTNPLPAEDFLVRRILEQVTGRG